MAVELTPVEIVEKQIKAAQQRVGDYREGVRKTRKNPMERAKAKKQKLIDNFNEAVNSGKWEDGLDSVTFADWQEMTATKGGNNYVKGVEMAKTKLLAFQEQFTPFRRSVRDQVDQMPNDTFEQRLARMQANAVGLHQFRFRKRSMRRMSG